MSSGNHNKNLSKIIHVQQMTKGQTQCFPLQYTHPVHKVSEKLIQCQGIIFRETIFPNQKKFTHPEDENSHPVKRSIYRSIYCKSNFSLFVSMQALKLYWITLLLLSPDTDIFCPLWLFPLDLTNQNYLPRAITTLYVKSNSIWLYSQRKRQKNTSKIQ